MMILLRKLSVVVSNKTGEVLSTEEKAYALHHNYAFPPLGYSAPYITLRVRERVSQECTGAWISFHGSGPHSGFQIAPETKVSEESENASLSKIS